MFLYILLCLEYLKPHSIIIQRAGYLLAGLILPYVCACLKLEPESPKSFDVAFLFVQWYKVRGDCSVCWHYHIVNYHCLDVRFIISWRSALLLEDNGVPRDNHWPNACDRRTLSHKVAPSTPCHERKLNSPWVTSGFMVGLVVLIVLVFCVVLCFLTCLSASCVLSARCCRYLWIPLSWLTFRFSLMFIKLW